MASKASALKRNSTTALGSGPLKSGPWKGVTDTKDPFDVSDDRLREARNCYIPDAQEGSGIFARNGFGAAYDGNPLTTSSLPGYPPYAQGIYTHYMLDGTAINFIACGGRLLRATNIDSLAPGAMTVTDVTPPGVSLSSLWEPVYMTSLVAIVGGVTQTVLIVSDGTTRPWVGTDLLNTPITGTPIDYDGLGTHWSAYGQPVVWQGALFCILNEVGAGAGVPRREDISWSEPGDPFTGWQQPASDNNMTLALAGAPGANKGPLTAIVPTNVAMYYFRSHSIGAIAGAIGSLTSTNTLDAISFNVGTTACRSIQQFGNSTFFADAFGRPYMLTPGGAPQPIWKQMRNAVANWGTYRSDNLPIFAASAIEPIHNLYLVTLRRPDESADYSVYPNQIFAFDALTGNYFGEWSIADRRDGRGGVGVGCLGILSGVEDGHVLFALGQGDTAAPDIGYGWFFRTQGYPSPDALQWLDGVDGSIIPNVEVTTDRLAENEQVRWFVDRVTLMTETNVPCSVGVETPPRAFPVLGGGGALFAGPIGVPADGTYRIVVHPEQYGRGPAVRVWPMSVNGQWGLHRITVGAVPSLAQVDDL
jgi:hypothetical protein